MCENGMLKNLNPGEKNVEQLLCGDSFNIKLRRQTMAKFFKKNVLCPLLLSIFMVTANKFVLNKGDF